MNSREQSWLAVVALAFSTTACSPPAGSTSPPSSAGSGYSVVVASITNRPSPVHRGDGVVFDYVLKNVGSNVAPAGSYWFDLYVDGQVVVFDHSTPELLPGRTGSYTMAPGNFNWQPTNVGQHHFELVLVAGSKTNRVGGDVDVLP